MNGGAYHQSGGFDPGLAALLATLLTGSVSAYGYNKDYRKTEDIVASGLKGEYEQRLKRAEAKDTQAAILAAEKADLQKKLLALEIETTNLKKKLEASMKESGPLKSADTAFQTANTQALEDAASKMMKVLEEKYPRLFETEVSRTAIETALKYPTTYQAKLSRLSLPVFYEKRMVPAFKTAQGDRNQQGGVISGINPLYANVGEEEFAKLRNYKGALENRNNWPDVLEGVGQAEAPEWAQPVSTSQAPPSPGAVAAAAAGEGPVAAPTIAQELESLDEQKESPTVTTEQGISGTAAAYGDAPFPTLMEFAKLYEEAIREATMTPRAAADERSRAFRLNVDTQTKAKRDAAAVKAAGVVRDKLQKVIENARKEIDENNSLVLTLSEDRQEALKTRLNALTEKLDAAEVFRGEKAKSKSWFGRGGAPRDLRTIANEADWNGEAGVKTEVEGLLESIPKDVKAYVEAIKQAAKEEKSELTMSGPEFGLPSLPTFTLSVGNPFEFIFKQVRDAKDKTKALADTRVKLKKEIDFIKSVVVEAKRMLTEIDTLRAVKEEDESIDADGDWNEIERIASQMREILDGPDGLEAALAKLSTGRLSGIADAARVSLGFSSAYTGDDVAKAGEKYVTLVPLQKQAKLLLAPYTKKVSKLKRFGIKTRRVGQRVSEGTRRVSRALKDAIVSIGAIFAGIMKAVFTKAKAVALTSATASASAARAVAARAQTTYTLLVTNELPRLKAAISTASQTASEKMKAAYTELETALVKSQVATGEALTQALDALAIARVRLAKVAADTGEAIAESVDAGMKSISNTAAVAGHSAWLAGERALDVARIVKEIPGKTAKILSDKYQVAAKAYAEKNQRMDEATVLKDLIKSEQDAIASSEKYLTNLAAIFTSTGWKLDTFGPDQFASIQVEVPPSLLSVMFDPAARYKPAYGNEEASRQAIFDAGKLIFKSLDAIKTVKESETYKQFEASALNLKPAAKAGEGEFFKANNAVLERLAAFETAFREVIDTVQQDTSTALEKLVEAGVPGAPQLMNRMLAEAESKRKAIEEEAEAKQKASLGYLVREARGVTEAKESATEAERSAKAQALEAKKAAAEMALAKKAKETEVADTLRAKKAGIEEIVAIDKGLEAGKPMTAEIERALTSNYFIGEDIADTARETVDQERQTLVDEVDRLESILAEAKQPKDSPVDQIEADKVIQETTPLLESANQVVTDFDEEAPAKIYANAKEIAEGTLGPEIETYKKRTGTFGNIFMGRSSGYQSLPTLEPEPKAPVNTAPVNVVGKGPLTTSPSGRFEVVNAMRESPVLGALSDNLKRGVSGRFYANFIGPLNNQITPGESQESIVHRILRRISDSWKAKTPKEREADKNTELYKETLGWLNTYAATKSGGAGEDVNAIAIENRNIASELIASMKGARRSRKSTLKKRRGGKQNGRGSRRRKNRTDRTHSHSR